MGVNSSAVHVLHCKHILSAQDLLQRGVDAAVIDAALRSFFGDEQQSLRVTVGSSTSRKPSDTHVDDNDDDESQSVAYQRGDFCVVIRSCCKNILFHVTDDDASHEFRVLHTSRVRYV